ncbi:hypothetical protein [Paraburkholderia tuberum]|uniref:hypothetical protein n=1 Tax=Paraburkholderia tuberum TaxID=157910 RepID=UPI000A4DECA3|nr:hypothetical protein [Paraburkholderia tuberum]
MSPRRTSSSRLRYRLFLASLLTSITLLQGCATTAENLAVGFGVGAVGTVSALGCLLACEMANPHW